MSDDSGSPVAASELGDAMLAAAAAQAHALAMYSAVSAQQNGAIARQAAAMRTCAALIEMASGSRGEAASADDGPMPPSVSAEQTDPNAQPGLDSAEASSSPLHRAIALAAALAMQDAVDDLRAATTIAATAEGLALARLARAGAGGEGSGQFEAAARRMADAALERFERIGAVAVRILAASAERG